VRSLIIHLHLAQPPREDPWFGGLDAEPDAAPDHDWHARFERVCYRTLLAARVLDADGRIARVIDTLALASFDVAPTLLAWMERHAPSTYAALLAADRASVRRLGHGNALAHPYDHAILPLLSRRDKATEVRWGIAAFRRHFGRDPEGMWLPETAADDETLDVLAEHGVRFTVLAAHQVVGMPGDGRPGRYRTATGREIALFVHDEALTREVASGALLRDGRLWARRMAGEVGPDPLARLPHPVRLAERHALADAGPGLAGSTGAGQAGGAQGARTPGASGDGTAPQGAAEHPSGGAADRPHDPVRRDDEGTVIVATLAEAYGHHHPLGEMALAAMYDEIAQRPHVQVENFARALARQDARDDARRAAAAAAAARSDTADDGVAAAAVALAAPSSWSCPHGVERWRSACGCRDDASTHQAWREPLRTVVAEMAGVMHRRFAREGAHLFGGEEAAWAARDAYGGDGGGRVPATIDPVWARELLEMERELLALGDSHAWGADDLGASAVRQLLGHAARAVALAGPERGALERHVMERLAGIRGSVPADGSARDLYLRHARHPLPAAVRVAAAWAVLRAVGATPAMAAPVTWAVEERATPSTLPDGRDPARGRDGDDRHPADAAATAAGVGAVAAARVQPVAADVGGGESDLSPLDFIVGGPVELTIIERRLGAMARYLVTVDVPGPAEPPDVAREDGRAAAGTPRHRLSDVDPRAITVFVQPVAGADSPSGTPGGLATALKLEDLPERARQAVLFALRRAVVSRLLDPIDRERLASGAATLRELVERALVDAVEQLGTDTSAATQARVLGLADLAESVAGGIPYDAQTMLARVRSAVDVAGRARIAPVAWRLGFSSRAWMDLAGTRNGRQATQPAPGPRSP
jgi:hypothetical protein